MTLIEWFEFVEQHREKLLSVIGQYHPVVDYRASDMKITAPTAELACENVRQNIRRNFEGHPVTLFEEAIAEKNFSKAYKILDDTWFGVPESTDCWRIDGFAELVNLMDDPPE